MPHREIPPEALAGRVSPPFGPYSHGVVAACNRIVFVAGQIPLDGNGDLVGDGDLASQYRATLENIRAVVEAAGGTLRDVCLLRHYVTVGLSNGDSTYQQLAKVRGEFFAAPYPVSTMMQVAGLMEPGVMIEVEAVAALDDLATSTSKAATS